MNQHRWVRPLEVEPGHWKKQLPTKFLKLATTRDDTALKQLLSKQPELINRRGPHGRTFLFEAIRRRKIETAKWLLKRGSNPNLTGCYNSETFVQLNSLAAARYYADADMEHLLQRYGAHWDIWRAAFCNETNRVFSFLAKEPELLNSEDSGDEIYFHSPLSFAVAGGQLELAKELFELGSELTQYGVQLLFIASHLERIDIVQWLIACGACATDADASLWQSTRDLTILKLLVGNGLSANQRPYSDLTPLHYACRGDKGENVEKVKLLLALGAHLNAVGPKHRTPLHYAAIAGYDRTVQELLAADVDQQIQDENGCTPLDLAISKNRQGVINLLQS